MAKLSETAKRVFTPRTSLRATISTHTTQRITLYIDSKTCYVTYITDEFSSYVWAVFANEKKVLRERIERTLKRINHEHYPFNIFYITKDNGTELLNVSFFENELNAI